MLHPFFRRKIIKGFNFGKWKFEVPFWDCLANKKGQALFGLPTTQYVTTWLVGLFRAASDGITVGEVCIEAFRECHAYCLTLAVTIVIGVTNERLRNLQHPSGVVLEAQAPTR